jgi:hypothetical protein
MSYLLVLLAGTDTVHTSHAEFFARVCGASIWRRAPEASGLGLVSRHPACSERCRPNHVGVPDEIGMGAEHHLAGFCGCGVDQLLATQTRDRWKDRSCGTGGADSVLCHRRLWRLAWVWDVSVDLGWPSAVRFGGLANLSDFALGQRCVYRSRLRREFNVPKEAHGDCDHSFRKLTWASPAPDISKRLFHQFALLPVGRPDLSDGLKSWMVNLDAYPKGGMKLDGRFFVEFDGPRIRSGWRAATPHLIRTATQRRNDATSKR